uniref:Uncharacterized protein n=1 Tax=Onchocerca volvulus TaxID=6282 RepID=A0A2K6W9J1_ONCVO
MENRRIDVSVVFPSEFNWYFSGKYKTGSICQIGRNGCEICKERKKWQRQNCWIDSTQSTDNSIIINLN